MVFDIPVKRALHNYTTLEMVTRVTITKDSFLVEFTTFIDLFYLKGSFPLVIPLSQGAFALFYFIERTELSKSKHIIWLEMVPSLFQYRYTKRGKINTWNLTKLTRFIMVQDHTASLSPGERYFFVHLEHPISTDLIVGKVGRTMFVLRAVWSSGEAVMLGDHLLQLKIESVGLLKKQY